jgi:hypothetical protein
MTTRLRYEVWVSFNGEARAWKRLPRAIYHDVLGKQHALQMAELAAATHAKVVVEEYDDGRDVFLRNVIEYPVK